MATAVSTFKTRIRNRLGGRTDLNASLVEFINTAQTRIARRHKFADLRSRTTTFSFTDGVRLYDYSDVGTDCKTILSITLEGEATKLGHVALPVFDAWVPDPTDEGEGRPEYWYPADKTQFGVHPIPDTTYTAWIRYTSWASTLSDDTDTVAFANLDDVILYAALVEAYAYLQEWEDADKCERIFLQRLMAAMSDDVRQPDQALVMGAFRAWPRRVPQQDRI